MAMLHVALPWSHLPTTIYSAVFLDHGALQPTVSAFFPIGGNEMVNIVYNVRSVNEIEPKNNVTHSSIFDS